MKSVIDVNQLQRGQNKSQPLYLQIRDQLREEIISNRLKRGDKLPPVSELVQQAKVDFKTVNLALENLETEGLIRRPKGRGKGARVVRNSTRRFTVQLIRWDNCYLSMALTAGLQKFAEENGLRYIICDASKSHDDACAAIVHPMEKVDGMVIMPHDRDDYRHAIRIALDAGVKMVFVDRVLEDMPVSSVTMDNIAGGYQATQHLLEQHGRPVYCIGPVNDPSSARDRVKGWRAAMQEYHCEDMDRYLCGFSLPEHEIVSGKGDSSSDSYYVAGRLFAGSKERQFSLFAINDYVAMGVYHAAQDNGLEVGKDVFIVGFGDCPFCESMLTPLSSVRQRDDRVAYEAARLLLGEMTEDASQPIHRLIPVELKIRQSSINSEKGKA